MGLTLSHAVAPYGYACPWCPVVVIDAGMAPAVTVFELHVDGHLAAGDHLAGCDRRHRAPARSLLAG